MSNSPFSFLRRKRVFARSAVRHACQIDCELFLTDSEMSFDGRLTDISVGGAQFRPRLAYLMSRRNEPVELRVGSIAIRGELLTTSGAGFGIRFDRVMDEKQLLESLIRAAEPAPAAE